MIAAPAPKHRPHPRIHREFVPLQTVAPTQQLRIVGAATKDWIACPDCEKMVVGSAIHTAPKVEHFNGQHIVKRRFFCDHCAHVVFWLQKCTAAGELYVPPLVIDAPGCIKKPSYVNAFLKAHPECTGVEQSAPRPL